MYQPYKNEIALIPGIPVKPQIIWKWGDDVAGAWGKIGPCYVQPKYDGWQIQIHKIGDKVQIFTRTLVDYTKEFHDVVVATRSQVDAHDVILDCEVVGYKPEEQKLLPWNLVLNSKHHKVFVHDLLHLNGEDWILTPYEQRSHKFQEIVKPDIINVLEPVTDVYVSDFDTLNRIYLRSIEDDKLEGVIIKDPAGEYKPGKLNIAKGKIKPIYSLDVVVTCCRLSASGLINSIKVAVKNPESELVEICTVNKGIKDELQEFLLNYFLEQFTQEQLFEEKWYNVKPKIIIEIQSLFRIVSDKYPLAGNFTLENPILFRLRKDKSIEDIDTLFDFLSIKARPGSEDLIDSRQSPKQLALNL